MASDGGSRQLTPHFFKIILSHAQEHKLELPRKFVSEHGRDMSSGVAYLSVPGGSAWKVQLIKENQRAWFAQGWEAFVKFYSTVLGHFLMFKLVGNSIFHVIIFDMSTLEIEYPPHPEIVSNEAKSNKEDYDLSMDMDVEIEEIEDLESQDVEDSEVSVCSLDESSPSSRSEGEEEGPSWNISNSKMDFTKQQKRLFPYDKEILQQNYARACDGRRPSFIVKMRPSYVVFQYKLNVPRVFVNKYLGKNQKVVILQNERGDVWTVNSFNGKFLTGWKDFVMGNQLKVDDVCIFELIRGANISFRVVISRAADHA